MNESFYIVTRIYFKGENETHSIQIFTDHRQATQRFYNIIAADLADDAVIGLHLVEQGEELLQSFFIRHGNSPSQNGFLLTLYAIICTKANNIGQNLTEARPNEKSDAEQSQHPPHAQRDPRGAAGDACRKAALAHYRAGADRPRQHLPHDVLCAL